MSDKCDLYGADKVPKGYADNLSKEMMYRKENEQLKKENEKFKYEIEQLQQEKKAFHSDYGILAKQNDLMVAKTKQHEQERMDKFVCASVLAGYEYAESLAARQPDKEEIADATLMIAIACMQVAEEVNHG